MKPGHPDPVTSDSRHTWHSLSCRSIATAGTARGRTEAGRRDAGRSSPSPMPRRRKEASAVARRPGFEVVAVEDAPQALEQIGRLRPAVVLADTALRDARGRGLCQAVRQLARARPCRLLALCSGSREVAAALEAGASDVLEGPFDGRVAARRAERLAPSLRDGGATGPGAGGERAAAQGGRGRAAGDALARALRRAHRPARRRAARAHPRERPGRRVREEPGGGRAVRHRAPGHAQHPPGTRARELRPPAGGAASRRRAPLRGDAALRGRARRCRWRPASAEASSRSC